MKRLFELVKSLTREDFKELMSFLSVTTAFVYFFLITFISIPKESQRFADIILGMLGTAVLGRVYGYYFDADKDKNKDIEK